MEKYMANRRECFFDFDLIDKEKITAAQVVRLRAADLYAVPFH